MDVFGILLTIPMEIAAGAMSHPADLGIFPLSDSRAVDYCAECDLDDLFWEGQCTHSDPVAGTSGHLPALAAYCPRKEPQMSHDVIRSHISRLLLLRISSHRKIIGR